MKSNLNEKQREAVYLDFGPAMILAGPGSGKTTVILERIKYLIYDLHISPKQILVITFTKAAAMEMQTRAAKVINNLSESPIFGTFHSYFYSVLKNTYEFQNYSILTTKQKYKNLEKLLSIKFQKDKLSNHLLGQIITCISKYKNGMDISEDIIQLEFSKEAWEELCECYDYFNREQNQMDYDDILLYAHKLLKNNKELLCSLQKQIKYILVDEFQDVNKKQYELVSMLAGKDGNLFVVGDDDQSIYRFRGAGEENLFRFETDFKSARKVILGRNYRCPKEIVHISEALISNNENRFQKELVAAKDLEGEILCKKFLNKDLEREFIVSKVQELLRSGENKNIAILCRTNSQLDYFAELFRKKEIAFFRQEKGINFYQTPYIKPIIGYLMFASFTDRSRKVLLSFINKPMRYIERELFINWDLGSYNISQIETGNKQADYLLDRLNDMLKVIERLPPKMAIQYILKAVGYEEYVVGQCKSKTEIANFYEAMRELKERAATYENIRQWMKYIKWLEDTEMDNLRKVVDKKVNLYTFHGAKGLEFNTVFIPHVNEGSIPYGKNLTKKQLEEERRMFYVALTRTIESLYLTCVENDTKKDTVSRFLKECKLTASK